MRPTPLPDLDRTILKNDQIIYQNCLKVRVRSQTRDAISEGKSFIVAKRCFEKEHLLFLMRDSAAGQLLHKMTLYLVCGQKQAGRRGGMMAGASKDFPSGVDWMEAEL